MKRRTPRSTHFPYTTLFRSRGLMRVESCVKEEENSSGFYVANSEENLIKGVSAAKTINMEDTLRSREFKNQIEQERKQNWIEKKMYGQFVREMPENVDNKDITWQWLSKCDLKIERQKRCYVQHRNRPSGQTM